MNYIEILEDEISDIIIPYYIERPFKINDRTVNMSIFELIQRIKYDYNNIVLKDFYEEFD